MHFPARAASILFLSIFGHKIGVLKSPTLFQGKELQVTRFKVMCFCFHLFPTLSYGVRLAFFSRIGAVFLYLRSRFSALCGISFLYSKTPVVLKLGGRTREQGDTSSRLTLTKIGLPPIMCKGFP